MTFLLENDFAKFQQDMTAHQKEKTFCSTEEAAEMLGLSPAEIDALMASRAIETWDGARGRKHILRQSVQALRKAGAAWDPLLVLERPPLRVYVVDADQSVLSHYRDLLGQVATRVLPVFFDSIFDALLNIGRHPPDVLIVDLWTPAVDWFPMIQALGNAPELHQLK